MPNGSSLPPQQFEGPPGEQGGPAGPAPPSMGTMGVIGVRIAASIMAVLALIFLAVFIANTEGTDPDMSIFTWVFGGIAVGLGVVGCWIKGIRISTKKFIPPLNILLVMIGGVFFFIAPIFGLWGDGTYAAVSELSNGEMLSIVLYAFFVLSFIEFGHASYRFGEISEYAHKQRLTDFSVDSVIGSYFIWYPILMGAIILVSFVILRLNTWVLIPLMERSAPAFAESIEITSVYGMAISMALILVPIGIILVFVFGEGSLIGSSKTVLVKSQKDDDYL